MKRHTKKSHTKHSYTQEQKDFLLQSTPPLWKAGDALAREDLADNFNNRFDTQLSAKTLTTRCHALHRKAAGKAKKKVKSTEASRGPRVMKIKKHSKHRWTIEMETLAREVDAKGGSLASKIRRFNARSLVKVSSRALEVRICKLKKKESSPTEVASLQLLPEDSKNTSTYIVFVNDKEVWKGNTKPVVRISATTTTTQEIARL